MDALHARTRLPARRWNLVALTLLLLAPLVALTAQPVSTTYTATYRKR